MKIKPYTSAFRSQAHLAFPRGLPTPKNAKRAFVLVPCKNLDRTVQQI